MPIASVHPSQRGARFEPARRRSARPPAAALLAVVLACVGSAPAHAAPQPDPASSLVPPPSDQAARADKEANDKKRRKKDSSRRPHVSGYLQAFYRYTWETGDDGAVDSPNFRVQRVRVAVSGKVIPRVSYQIEIDPRAPEITGILRDAYLQLKLIPYHRLRIGQQKTQFGYEGRTSSTRLFAVNRTEVSDNLSRGPSLRDIGLGLLGRVPLAGGFRLEDAITVTNGNGSNTQIDDTDRKSVWGRLGARVDDGAFSVALGVSGGIGDFVDEGDDPADPADDFRVKYQRLGSDVELDTPWAFLSAEIVWSKDEAEGETVRPRGYYVNLVGRTPWQVGPIARYDAMDIPDEDYRRWTLGAYHDMADGLVRWMVNYEYREVQDGVRGDDRLYLWTQVRF